MRTVSCLLVTAVTFAVPTAVFAQTPKPSPRVTYRTDARASRENDTDGVIRYRLYRKSGEIIGIVNYREVLNAYAVELPDGRRTTFARSAVEKIEKLSEDEIAELQEQRSEKELAAIEARAKERQQEISLLEAKERADKAAAAKLEAEAKIRAAETARLETNQKAAPSRFGSSTSASTQRSTDSTGTGARTTSRSTAPTVNVCGAPTATGACQNRVTDGGYCWLHAPSKSSGSSSAASSSSGGGTVQVKGYYRKDGTYVAPHTRSASRRK